MIKYRPDIDGLRALAVLPVVLFHAGVSGFGGGYVGVDVFFVISGFLITSIIVREIDEGSFTIAGFYERRIRRIFPALTAVMVFTAMAGFFILIPGDLSGLGKSMLATTFFVSNILFWQEAGYFAGHAEEFPLLHSWSLAVEEQFYIFFPLYLVLIAGYFKKKWLLPTLFIFVVSFAVSIWGVEYEPTATFYLLPTRAWELLMGSLLAMNIFPALKRKMQREILGVIALGLILYPVIFYTKQTHFPGFNALAPCLGAAFIIYLGMDRAPTFAGKMLSHSFFVKLGLISYSLYLWHWPIIVYAKYLTFGQITDEIQFIIIFLSLLLSFMSWHWIERPFRGQGILRSRRSVFMSAGVVMTIFLVIGGSLYISKGVPMRLHPSLVAIENQSKAQLDDIQKCAVPLKGKDYGLSMGLLCKIGDISATPDFILLGDSHAMALRYILSDMLIEHGRSGYLLSNKGCSIIPGMRYDDQKGRGCDDFTAESLAFIEKRPELKDILIVSRWSRPVIGSLQFSGSAEQGQAFNMYTDRNYTINTKADRIRAAQKALPPMIEKLAADGKNVFINTPVPEIGYDVPKTFVKRAYLGRDIDIRLPRADYNSRHSWFFEILPEIEAAGGKIIHLENTLCDAAFCNVYAGDMPLYFDDDHLSKHGGEALKPSWTVIFE